MKDVDLISLIVGAIASFSRAIKKRLNWRMIIVSTIVGAILGFGVIGVLSFFVKGMSIQMAVIASFAGGWVSNEITDIIEEAVKDSYDFAKAYARTRFEDKKNRKSKNENDGN